MEFVPFDASQTLCDPNNQGSVQVYSQGGSARRNAYENIAVVIADKQWFQLIFNGRVMKCAIIVMRLKNLPKSILFIGIYWLCGLKNFGDTSCSRMR